MKNKIFSNFKTIDEEKIIPNEYVIYCNTKHIAKTKKDQHLQSTGVDPF